MCTMNDNHMMYGSWDIECDWLIFLSFWTIFCPLTTWKIRILKKWKKNTCRYYDFTYVYHKWQLWCVKDIIFCQFGPFFALLPTNNLKNQNFEKLKKRPRDIIILHKCTKNHDHMLYCFWDMARDGCNLFFILGYFLPFYHPTPEKNP